MKRSKSLGTLCWDCVHSVPNREGTKGCTWSRRFQPVPGWEAERTFTQQLNGQGRVLDMQSYMVYDCPQFQKERREK